MVSSGGPFEVAWKVMYDVLFCRVEISWNEGRCQGSSVVLNVMEWSFQVFFWIVVECVYLRVFVALMTRLDCQQSNLIEFKSVMVYCFDICLALLWWALKYRTYDHGIIYKFPLKIFTLNLDISESSTYSIYECFFRILVWGLILFQFFETIVKYNHINYKMFFEGF